MLHKNKKIFLLSIVFLLVCSIISCGKDKLKSNGFKIYYNKNTIKQVDALKKVVSEYEKTEGVKIEFVGVENEEDIKSKIGSKNEASVVLLDGYAFLDFINDDYLRDVSYLYKEKHTRAKFSVITNIYGRYAGRYYGVGIMPFSLQLIGNKKLLKEKEIVLDEENISNSIIKLKDKGIKIPVYLNNEYPKELLITSLIVNDTIIYDQNITYLTRDLEKEILNIRNGQKIFSILNEFYKKGSFREENFVEGNKEVIEKFNKGESPIILTTTLESAELNNKLETVVINKLPILNKEVSPPVGINIVVGSTIGESKIDDVDGFLRFLIQDDGIEKLSNYNIITGNRKGDSNLTGVQGQMVSGVQVSDEINRFYFNIISNEDIKLIVNEAKKVMNGNYDGKEWNRIIRGS